MIITESYMNEDGSLYSEDTIEATGTKCRWVFIKVSGQPTLGTFRHINSMGMGPPEVPPPIQQSFDFQF